MRHVPVPKGIEEVYPGYQRVVVSPPGGDLLNDECRAADMLIGIIDFMGTKVQCNRAFFTLEDGDLERLQAGMPIGIMFISSQIPPFDCQVY